MDRTAKNQEIETLNKSFNDNEIIVVTHNTGLTVAQVTALRRAARAESASYKVSKNTLARRAAQGTKFEGVSDLFKGPVGLVTSKDPVAAAKVAYEFAKKNNKLVIIGGGFGEMKLDAARIEQLAKLPSLDALRSTLVGLLVAPAQKLARIAQAPAQQLVQVTKAYGEKQ